MKLQTTIPLNEAHAAIDYERRVLLLGSCFAAHLGQKLAYYKFRSVCNPLGILFHSAAIEKIVGRALEGTYFNEGELLYYNDLYHHFDAHSCVSDVNKTVVLQQLNTGLDQIRDYLRSATHIVITLGTAWAYRHLKTNALVANCHKVPQRQFKKELLPIGTIAAHLNGIIHSVLKVNQDAQFIFTVSPVRHLKDGFTENQRSKAHLIAALHQVLETSGRAANLSYFPSYELMMDELRDYRFYETDMVHPNALAVSYIWEKFAHIWITAPAKETMRLVAEIQEGLAHRPFNPGSGQHQRFLKVLDEKIKGLQKDFPHISFQTKNNGHGHGQGLRS